MDMYKVVWIARYRNGMTRQDASDYWAGHHGPLMKKVSPVSGYVQSHVQGPLPAVSGVAEEETLFDGYSCAWWKDRSDFQQAMSTPAWQRIVEDGPNVFDTDWLWNMSAHIEEVPMIEGPTSPYKVVWIIRFKEGLTREEGETGKVEIGFDGFSECWFRDETQFRNAVESSTWAVAVEDAQNVFDMTQMWGAALRENIVVPPPLLGI
jgi:uncharacterized protein (TIGR02118 family)